MGKNKNSVLVLWEDTLESSVIYEKSLKVDSSGSTTAKWGKKWFPVKVLLTSGTF